MSLVKYLSRLEEQRILVIGDVMLDKFIWGSVSRISPEAPVQVVNVSKETFAAGGASNVAVNISTLNDNTSIMGVMGEDETKNILLDILLKKKVDTRGIIIDKKKPTVKKTRVLAQNQQLLRIDYEQPEYIDEKDEQKMIALFDKVLSSLTCIVISDYAKGVVTKKFISHVIAQAKNIPVIIDPKPKHVNLYRGATLITPNHKEACEMIGEEVANNASLLDIGTKLMKKTRSNILVTRGEKGMSLFKQDGAVIHIPTKAKEVYDVTGAGDTVIALLALSLGAGAQLEESAEIANHGAGIVVGKVGTATVSLEELKRSLENA